VTHNDGGTFSITVMLLVSLLLTAVACHGPTSPSAGNRVVSATVLPASGPLTSPSGGIGFSVSVQCAGAYVTGVIITREDGQMDYLGVFLPCPARVSEYHGASEDFYASVWRLGQGGHQVSLKVVVATDEQNARAGNILFRSAALATWQIP
jgi:hypothetical protein